MQRLMQHTDWTPARVAVTPHRSFHRAGSAVSVACALIRWLIFGACRGHNGGCSCINMRTTSSSHTSPSMQPPMGGYSQPTMTESVAALACTAQPRSAWRAAQVISPTATLNLRMTRRRPAAIFATTVPDEPPPVPMPPTEASHVSSL